MRTKNALRNTAFSLLLEVLLLIFGMIMPRLIILTYGSAVNGLTSAINQILSILNLLQAGAVGASIFEMYKPVAEKDYQRISLIMDASKRYFFKLGLIFLGLVMAIAPLVAISKADAEIGKWEILISVIILGINGAYYFFILSWYDILFSSHQKRYILSIAGIIEKLIYYGLLFIVLKSSIHFIFMYFVVLCGSTIKVLFLYYIYKKKYSMYMVPVPKDNRYEIKNRGYLLCNQVATQAVESSPVILITILYDLKLVSVFSIYNLVQMAIKMLINTVQYSISAVFGNVVVAESEEKVKNVFNIMQFVFCMMGVFICSCMIIMFMPFVRLYTIGITDANYIYPILAFLIVVNTMSFSLYIPYCLMANVYGFFKETYLQAMICAVFSIAFSCIFGMVYMPLVLIGLIFYYLSSFIYRLLLINNKISWFRFEKMPRRIAVLVLFPFATYIMGEKFTVSVVSWMDWFIVAFLIAVAVIMFMLMYVGLFERKEFATCMEYGKDLLKSRKKNI
jgi:O-antigen/teichoic acid export membrane protein